MEGNHFKMSQFMESDDLLCSACGNKKDYSWFSKNQQRKGDARRCRTCVDQSLGRHPAYSIDSDSCDIESGKIVFIF